MPSGVSFHSKKFWNDWFWIFAYHKKNGNQQAKNADTIIPRVLAAFLSLFILLQVPGSEAAASTAAPFSGPKPASIDCLRVVKPAEMPFICRCLLSRAAATLLLKKRQKPFRGYSDSDSYIFSTTIVPIVEEKTVARNVWSLKSIN